MISRILYYAGKHLVNLFFRIFTGINYIGLEKIPRKGPLILASNHISNYDPFAVGTGVSGHVCYIAKKELFENRIQGTALSILGAFPVDRENASPAVIRKALNILKSGSRLGIFPEGTRSRDGQLQAPQQGTATFSIMSGAPILPSAITGTINLRKKGGIIPCFNRIHVIFGDLIYPDQFTGSRKERIEKITEKLMSDIRNLKEELDNRWAQ